MQVWPHKITTSVKFSCANEKESLLDRQQKSLQAHICLFSTGGCGSVRVGRERYCSGVACHVSTADSTLMVGGI